jgi:ribosomal protein S18 acetylase RimI-like enzyme
MLGVHNPLHAEPRAARFGEIKVVGRGPVNVVVRPERDRMDQGSIALRAAEPINDEGIAFARYLDEAAEGFFRFMLGRRSEEIIATAFAVPKHDLSFENVTFAEQDGATVGMVSGYSAEQHRQSSLQPLMQAAGRHPMRMRIVRILFAPIFRVIDSVDYNDFYLQALAVDEHVRGQGIGAILMDYIEERARQSGASRLCLDVSAGNQAAIGFYQSRGMTFRSQWPKRVKIPGLKFYRMIIKLR